MYALIASQNVAADAHRKFVFPDTPPATGDVQLYDMYMKIREVMESASKAAKPLTQAEVDDIRAGLTQLSSGAPDDPVATYAQRRLIILDWQSGKATASEAADQLRELAIEQQDEERYFTLAMILTIELRERQVERFRQEYPSLPHSRVPQFGWFVFENANDLIQEYISEGATREQAIGGQPAPEEYRRKVEVADFLEEVFFPSLEDYLSQYNERISQAPPGSDLLISSRAKLERAQIVVAMQKLTEGIRKYLGGRKYLDISERTTDVLLPRSLELWESAVSLIEADQDFLESPDNHRKEIATFRDSIVPHLKDLQEGQHLLREYGSVISSQEDKIEKLDREELDRLAAAQKKPSESQPIAPSNRRFLLILNLVLISVVIILVFVRWKHKANRMQDSPL